LLRNEWLTLLRNGWLTLLRNTHLTIRTFIGLIILHYLTIQLITKTARFLGYENKLTGTSRYDFFAYESTLLFTAPMGFGLFDTLVRQLIMVGPLHEAFGTFGILNVYLLSLTIWSYDSSYEKFRLKPVEKIVKHVFVYLLFSIILNIISFTLMRSGFYNAQTISYLFYGVIDPTVIGLLTIFFIKKNGPPKINNA
jgi:hypothetical protein